MADCEQDKGEGTSAPVMFKKRAKSGSAAQTRRIASASPAIEATPEPSGSGSNIAAQEGNREGSSAFEGEDADGEGAPSNLAELIALRKLRQSIRKEGIDLEKLNAGPKTKKKKRKNADKEEDEHAGYGLQTGKGKGVAGDDSDDDDGDANAITRKIMKTDNFTHQTGIVDVDKHMMAYIERELKKRRGQDTGEMDVEKEMQSLDPRDELYKVAEKYKRTTNKPVEEGNVATSAAMLTAIPEIDLGIDNRLKNIEQTERAKRRLQEQREKAYAAAKANGELGGYNDASYAGLRYFRHVRGNQTDFDVLRQAKIEAGGEEDSEEEKYTKEMGEAFKKEAKAAIRQARRREIATDDIVAERFRKKTMNGPKGKWA